jgi:hypothetical protein
MRHVIVFLLALSLAGCGESCQGESMVDQLTKGPPKFDAAPKVQPAPDKAVVKDFVRNLFKKKEDLWTKEERELFKEYVAGLRAFDKKHKREFTKLLKDFEKSFRELIAKEEELRNDPKRAEKLQLWWDNTFAAQVQTLIVETGKLCERGDESEMVPNFYELHEMMKVQLPDLIQSKWQNPKDKAALEQFDFYKKRGDELIVKMTKHLKQIDQK